MCVYINCAEKCMNRFQALFVLPWCLTLNLTKSTVRAVCDQIKHHRTSKQHSESVIPTFWLRHHFSFPPGAVWHATEDKNFRPASFNFSCSCVICVFLHQMWASSPWSHMKSELIRCINHFTSSSRETLTSSLLSNASSWYWNCIIMEWNSRLEEVIKFFHLNVSPNL